MSRHSDLTEAQGAQRQFGRLHAAESLGGDRLAERYSAGEARGRRSIPSFDAERSSESAQLLLGYAGLGERRANGEFRRGDHPGPVRPLRI